MKFPILSPTTKALFLMVVFLGVLFPSSIASADVAPPALPPGSNIAPGSQATQVRMMAETVTLNVKDKASAGSLGEASTEADFTMRNLGAVEESMDVRFPLTFFDGQSDGFGKYPEINDLRAFVNGEQIGTKRITTPNTYDSSGPAVPWASFPVKFPVGKDVSIVVKYTTKGYGIVPYLALRYVLETGAGWNGTIGSADVIVKLPYEANNENVMLDEGTGFSQTTPGSAFSANEVRWHFEDFEPTAENNIEISLVIPSFWDQVLAEQAAVKKSPNDSEAWGGLGKAYKLILGLEREYRSDPGGETIYNLSQQAYTKAVTLKPKDALWHYGFAELLWYHYYYNVYSAGSQDTTELVHALQELNDSLQIDPNDTMVQNFADQISYRFPDVLAKTDHGYVFLALTAPPAWTPVTMYATPTGTATSAPPATQAPATLASVQTEAPIATTVSAQPAGGVPFCGGAFLILPLLLGLFWFANRRSN